MTDYIVVYNKDLDDLIKEVNAKLDIGYIPVDGLVVKTNEITNIYYQAMIKK